MDPIRRILENRDLLREKNLKSEKKIWKKISKLKNENIILKNETFKINFNTVNLEEFNQQTFQRVFNTLIKSIYRMNKAQYSLSSVKDINLEILKLHVSKILKTDKEIQIYFCTEPNKQGVDEDEQLVMLNEKLNILNYKASGDRGNIFVSKKGISDEKHGLSKRIDALIVNKDYGFDLSKDTYPVFIGYNKFIKDAGGHQNNQINDACDFVKDSNNYCKNFEDKKFFYVQLDGYEAERKMYKVNNEIMLKDRICVGNTLKILDWVKKKILNNG